MKIWYKINLMFMEIQAMVFIMFFCIHILYACYIQLIHTLFLSLVVSSFNAIMINYFDLWLAKAVLWNFT